MRNNNIHPTAIISPNAEIGDNVKIGPYSVVGDNVKLFDNVELKSHVVVEGYTSIGKNTVIYPFASIGYHPQDLKYKGERSDLIIGENNVIREYVTIHPGTDLNSVTKVGSNCLLMVSVHIAHDCRVGDNVIMANNSTLAGHVVLGNNVIMGGLSAVHQFVRIGDGAIVGGLSAVDEDVIPYATVKGERAFISGPNLIGMKRSGFSREEISAVLDVFEYLFNDSNGLFSTRVDYVKEKYHDHPKCAKIIEFLSSNSTRPICKRK